MGVRTVRSLNNFRVGEWGYPTKTVCSDRRQKHYRRKNHRARKKSPLFGHDAAIPTRASRNRAVYQRAREVFPIHAHGRAPAIRARARAYATIRQRTMAKRAVGIKHRRPLIQPTATHGCPIYDRTRIKRRVRDRRNQQTRNHQQRDSHTQHNKPVLLIRNRFIAVSVATSFCWGSCLG